MKVNIQLKNLQERTYEHVVRVDDSDHYKITVYGENGVLAIINRGELQNLFTEDDGE